MNKYSVASFFAVLLISVGVSNAQMNDDAFFIGSNPDGQTGTTYLAATACGDTTPFDPATIGFPGLHVILTVEEGATGSATLSQNATTTVAPGNSIQCGAGGIHAGHSFYRSFNLAAQGITGDFEIGSINVGIDISLENATGAGSDFDGMQPLQCNFYWTTPVLSIVHDGVNGPLGMDAGFDFLIPGDGSADETVLNVPVSGVTVPASATNLVVEIFAFGSDTLLLPVIGGSCDNEIGDVNGDGALDLLDVGPFVNAVTGGFVCEADIDENGVVDLLDVGPFVALLLGG